MLNPDVPNSKPAPGTLTLALNAGSSSVRFALFSADSEHQRVLSGKIERLGLSGTQLTLNRGTHAEKSEIQARTHADCAPLIIELLQREVQFSRLDVIVHRIVHGGNRFGKTERISRDMLVELKRIMSYAPEHLPAAIALIEAFTAHAPALPQAACFDTAFHRDLPMVAQRLPLPRKYFDQGVRRYGFHGISYAYLLKEYERLAGPDAARARIIIAHLGNGASLAAVSGGRCIDTTMSFTPTAGLVMSTRSGDLDPGLAAYFFRTEGMKPDAFHAMINSHSGLRGISDTSSDVRDLLAIEATDSRAAEALESFCYQARKQIGALTAALGGLDAIIFSAGIGENSPVLRERICAGLSFLGLTFDADQNKLNAQVISRPGSKVAVWVLKTDEELSMAQAVAELSVP